MFNFKKKNKMRTKSFSLIELLIVIGIMGALAALILPSFSDSETAAKDTACDYNNAGILRYVTMFKATNGVYPSGFHTGASDAAGEKAGDPVSSMAVVTAGNINGFTDKLEIDKDDGTYGQSLQSAGIAQLAYGTEVADDIGDVTAVLEVTGDWSETMDANGAYLDVATDGAPAITVRGLPLSTWKAAGEAEVTDAADYEALDDNLKKCRKANEGAFKIVPLFAASTIDWETAHPYQGLAIASKVGVAMEGKCPWLDAGSFRYYICLFKVYEDGSPAKLIATACPECGVLDADNF